MNIKDIKWNEVNRFSQLIAIVLFVAVFVLGFYLGKTYEYHAFMNVFKDGLTASVPKAPKPIATATYSCMADKYIEATYWDKKVDLKLSDGRTLSLPHALSADGARYANADEAIVFWNKGNTAFITEGKDTTFADCAAKPIPQ